MTDLRKDALGDGSGSSNYYSYDIDSGKSAYMLVYEKKRKKDIRQVTEVGQE